MAVPPAWKYSLLQIPGAAVAAGVLAGAHAWLGLSGGLALGLLALWIAKDVVIYPFVRESLRDGHDRVGPEVLVGSTGVARDALNPSGYVQVRGELWRGELVGAARPLEAGSPIRVRDVDGLTLLVEPVPELGEAPQST